MQRSSQILSMPQATGSNLQRVPSQNPNDQKMPQMNSLGKRRQLYPPQFDSDDERHGMIQQNKDLTMQEYEELLQGLPSKRVNTGGLLEGGAATTQQMEMMRQMHKKKQLGKSDQTGQSVGRQQMIPQTVRLKNSQMQEKLIQH